MDGTGSFVWFSEYELKPVHRSNEAFLIPTDREEEYFLFENRQQEGNGAYIPGHGMLVWHIDFDLDIWLINAANNDPDHQRVDLIEADNKLTPDSRAGGAFPKHGRSNVFHRHNSSGIS